MRRKRSASRPGAGRRSPRLGTVAPATVGSPRVGTVAGVAAVLALAGGRASAAPREHRPTITKELFGFAPDNQRVDCYTLTNSHGMQVRIITFGGIVQWIRVPDRNHRMANVALGFATLDDYVTSNSPFFSALIGRYANRIANGTFTLDGVTYHLPVNNPPNSLHGGTVGFGKHGRVLGVFTDQPGIQFHSGNVLDSTLVGSGARMYRESDGFALETQHHPDSPNHQGDRNFPSVVLRPRETYQTTTVYKFSTD
jgi:galactose mutarotase-like enzyme